jgi:uncharacterized protein (TIRG00374 family)
VSALRGGLWLRGLLSVAVLAVVLLYAGVDEMAREVEAGDWREFLAAVALMGAACVVGGFRWRLLLQASEIHVAPTQAIQAFGVSVFLNNVLPTSVGGDAVRVWLVGRESGRLVRAAVATAVDRASAVACLFVVAWVTVALDPGDVPQPLVRTLFWVTLALVAAVVVTAFVAVVMRPVIGRLPERSAAMLREARATLSAQANSIKLAGWVLGMGMAYQALAVLALVFAGRTVGLDLPYPLAAVAAAIVVVAMLIPISIGGLGIREGGFVLLLGEAGVTGAEATLVSLLSVAATLLAAAAVVGLVAGRDLLIRRLRKRSGRHQQPDKAGA